MLARERTVELQSIFDRLKAQQRSGGGPSGHAVGQQANQAAALQQQRPKVSALAAAEALRFNETAQSFSAELASASQTIANLARLIQQQGVFDDQASEIGALTTIVKTKLGKLHGELNALAELREEAASRAGSSTVGLQADRHSDAVVSTLRSKLVTTSNSFKSLLQRRTQSMKESAHRRGKIVSQRQGFEEVLGGLTAQEEGATAGAGDHQQMALQTQNVNYFRQRQEAMRQVETAVREVGEMFSDFTRLVHEQEETIVRIDADVDAALENVNAGSGELMKYLGSLSSQRGLILKILAVLFVFLLFFGFVVVR